MSAIGIIKRMISFNLSLKVRCVAFSLFHRRYNRSGNTFKAKTSFVKIPKPTNDPATIKERRRLASCNVGRRKEKAPSKQSVRIDSRRYILKYQRRNVLKMSASVMEMD